VADLWPIRNRSNLIAAENVPSSAVGQGLNLVKPRSEHPNIDNEAWPNRDRPNLIVEEKGPNRDRPNLIVRKLNASPQISRLVAASRRDVSPGVSTPDDPTQPRLALITATRPHKATHSVTPLKKNTRARVEDAERATGVWPFFGVWGLRPGDRRERTGQIKSHPGPATSRSCLSI
jgi:hypothetical protein